METHVLELDESRFRWHARLHHSHSSGGMPASEQAQPVPRSKPRPNPDWHLLRRGGGGGARTHLRGPPCPLPCHTDGTSLDEAQLSRTSRLDVCLEDRRPYCVFLKVTPNKPGERRDCPDPAPKLFIRIRPKLRQTLDELGQCFGMPAALQRPVLGGEFRYPNVPGKCYPR